MNHLKNIILAIIVPVIFVLTLCLANKAAGGEAEAVSTLKSVSFRFSTGSGFYFYSPSGHRYVITNQHVCESGDVKDIVKQDATSDLCAVYASPLGPSVPLAPYSLESEEVYSYCPRGGRGVFSHGSFKTQFTWTSNEQSTNCPGLITGKCYHTYSSRATDLYSIPGCSGSPVVDVHGKLVGVVSSYSSSDDYSAGVVPFEKLKEFLNSL